MHYYRGFMVRTIETDNNTFLVMKKGDEPETVCMPPLKHAKQIIDLYWLQKEREYYDKEYKNT